MNDTPADVLKYSHTPELHDATLVLAFDGWMDGGDVSTGTVRRLVELTGAPQIAEIDPEPFYIYNFPGSMEVASLFRPHVKIADGLVESIDMPSSTFFCHEEANLVMFLGKEPNLRWQLFGRCIFELARKIGVQRILFVGSFGGSVPHTRQPPLYVTCSTEQLLDKLRQFGIARVEYEGPGSFISYLMTQAEAEKSEVVSLVAEIPSYLQGINPSCIEAVTRQLAKILQLHLDLDSLRSATTRWELHVSSIVDEDEELASEIRKLEVAYDDQLLERGADAEG